MTRMVHCRKLGKELPGLEQPPFPGAKGQEVYEHISAEAWQMWQAHQTMLINEKHLNLMDKEARKYLETERDRFFSGEEYDQPEGYVPPSE